MDVGWQALSLSPSWCKGKTILVRATDAIRLCREGGYEELPRMRAWEQLAGLRRQDMGRVRDFVSRARLTGFPLSSFEDGAVLALLRGAIKNQDLVLLRESAGAGKAPARPTAEQRKLIAKIEAQTRNRLSYLGRQYKLVADVDLSKTPQRDSYEVVRREDAIQVLDGLATQMGSSPELTPLLAKAREKLTADWRPPLSPDGLILLHRIPQLASSPDPTMPITPSQMKKLIEGTATRLYAGQILGPSGPMGNWPFLLKRDGRPVDSGSLNGSTTNTFKNNAWLSDRNGKFLFEDVPAGDYAVEVLLPAGDLLVNKDPVPPGINESGWRAPTPEIDRFAFRETPEELIG